jgi:sphingomyelin phosphodiesterase acid-like 3
MMMYQSYQASFLQILAKYPDLITMTLGAHTHMDEYRILSPSIVLDEVPAITPCFGENPAFKIFTLTQDTLTPIDYSSLNYDLSKVPLPTQFNSYYTFSTAYSLQGPLGASLIQLYPELANNVALTSAPATPNANAQQTAYMVQYNSGNSAWNPLGKPPGFWNSATPATWPVFACGIGKTTQLDFEDCVNSY